MYREPVYLEKTFLTSDERAWYRGESCWNCEPVSRRKVLGIKIRK